MEADSSKDKGESSDLEIEPNEPTVHSTSISEVKQSDTGPEVVFTEVTQKVETPDPSKEELESSNPQLERKTLKAATKPRKVIPLLTKRKTALFKKALKLYEETSAEVGVIVCSTTGHFESYGSPKLKTLVESQGVNVMKLCLDPNTPDSLDCSSEEDILLDVYSKVSDIRRSHCNKKVGVIDDTIDLLLKLRRRTLNDSFIKEAICVESKKHEIKETDYVTSVKLSKDGSMLAVGSNNCVNLYNMQDYSLKHVFTFESDVSENNFVRALIFSSDNKYLYCGSEEPVLRQFDINAPDKSRVMNLDQEDIYCMECFNDEFVYLGCSDGTVHEVSTESMKVNRSCKLLTPLLMAMLYLGDDKILISSLGGSNHILEISSWDIVHTFISTNNQFSAAISPVDQTIAISCSNHIMYVTRDEWLTMPIGKHNDLITSLCYSKNPDLLISGSKDNKIYYWKDGKYQESKFKLENTVLSLTSCEVENNCILSFGCGKSVIIYMLSNVQN